MRLGRVVALASCVGFGCAQDRNVVTPVKVEDGPTRVLVTGFNDWKDLGDPPQLWRCRDNPSCQLLVGEHVGEPQPDAYAGALVHRLRADDGLAAENVEWTFRTMPVTWGAAEILGHDEFDIVINMGLGVYDRDDVLQLEAGAFNGRGNTADAASSVRPGKIDEGAQRVLRPPKQSGIGVQIEALAGQRFGDYGLVVEGARDENAYLCNETHYRALEALERSQRDGGRLQRAYFLHLPYARENDYALLAEAVASLIRTLVVSEG